MHTQDDLIQTICYPHFSFDITWEITVKLCNKINLDGFTFQKFQLSQPIMYLSPTS